MNYSFFLIPLLTSFTGWVVIKLTQVLLFRPHEPKRFLGLTIQGILPRYQLQMAKSVGQFAASQFTAFDNIGDKLSDPANFEKVRPLIEEHIDDFLRNKLKEQMPMISMFIGDKTITSLKEVFIKEIEQLFPRVIGQFAGNLGKDINIGQMVTDKIASVSPPQIEQLLAKDLRKAFGMAALFGALVGLLVGMVQLLILFLAS